MNQNTVSEEFFSNFLRTSLRHVRSCAVGAAQLKLRSYKVNSKRA